MFEASNVKRCDRSFVEAARREKNESLQLDIRWILGRLHRYSRGVYYKMRASPCLADTLAHTIIQYAYGETDDVDEKSENRERDAQSNIGAVSRKVDVDDSTSITKGK